MNRLLHLLGVFLCCGCTFSTFAQTGCPDCLINLPSTLPADTIYLDSLPDGQRGEYYDHDLSFRLPKSTDPVRVLDPSVPGGLNINEITVLGLRNVPAGLSWEVNQTDFDPSDETDGCIRFCGTPLQDGLFEIEVSLSARIAIINQTTSFRLPIYIAPASSNNTGFTLTDAVGCGETLAQFDNNNPSNGQSGYSYFWDFGNGNTSVQEAPSPQLYDQPGTYIVQYQAIIDTAAYTLAKITLLEADCDDIFSRPDIIFEVEDPNGEVIFESEKFVDTRPPIEVSLNLELGAGNYFFKATDEDSGLEGSDDNCARTNFNLLSNDTLEGSGFKVIFEIFHPIDTIRVTDTVIVYEQPLQADLTLSGAPAICVGDSLRMTAAYLENVQWFDGEESIFGATDPDLVVAEAGRFYYTHTTEDGCTITSDIVEVVLNTLPDFPIFDNNNNLLEVRDPSNLPANYSLQWWLERDSIPGANGLSYCAMESGFYSLLVTDEATGCQRQFDQVVTIDPDVECTTTSTEDLMRQADWLIFPNPAREVLNMQWSDRVGEVELQLWDHLGRLLRKERVWGANIQWDIRDLESGLYWVTWRSGKEQLVQKVQVIR